MVTSPSRSSTAVIARWLSQRKPKVDLLFPLSKTPGLACHSAGSTTTSAPIADVIHPDNETERTSH